MEKLPIFLLDGVLGILHVDQLAIDLIPHRFLIFLLEQAADIEQKLQLMVETALDGYEPERPFVTIAFKALLDSPMRTFTELEPVKSQYVARVEQYFRTATERNEIPRQSFEHLLVNLLWDYMNLIMIYWLRDDSKGFANTTQLIDRSLDIYVDVVKSGIVTKTVDVMSFLIKSHLYGNIDKLYNLVGLLSQGHGKNRRSPSRDR